MRRVSACFPLRIDSRAAVLLDGVRRAGEVETKGRRMNPPFRQASRSPIVFSTEARGLATIAPSRGRQTPAEERETAEIKSVVLAQPHRRGDPSIRAGEPLWAFCRTMIMADEDFRERHYRAGVQYGEIVRQGKAALGFHVAGLHDPCEGDVLSEAQQAAMREAAIKRREDANAVLRGVIPRLVGAMERLCYDRLPWSPYDEGILRNGLWRLGVALGTIDRSGYGPANGG